MSNHAYIIEREREESSCTAAKLAAIIGEEPTWEYVRVNGKKLEYSQGTISGYVMMNSRGEYACEVDFERLVKIPVNAVVGN